MNKQYTEEIQMTNRYILKITSTTLIIRKAQIKTTKHLPHQISINYKES